MNFGAPIAIAFWIFILLVGIHEWWIEHKHRRWVARQREREDRLAVRLCGAEWDSSEDRADCLYVPSEWLS